MKREKEWRQSEHGVMRRVVRGDAEALARLNGTLVTDAWVDLVKRREEAIRYETSEPYEHMWEPPIWNVVRALLGWRLRGTNDAVRACERLGIDLVQMGERFLEVCGLSEAVQTLLILGGNRGGKTTCATMIGSEMSREIDGAFLWFFHGTEQQSVEYHQTWMHRFLESELRKKDIRSGVTYISYKLAMGFAEMQFTRPNATKITFKTLGMDTDKAVEGGKPCFVFADEALEQNDLVETLESRVAEQNGSLIVGFTPKNGYAGTVGMFLDDAQVTRRSVGWLLPRDGGPADVRRQLGIGEAEYASYLAWVESKGKTVREGRRCVAEDCYEWLGQVTSDRVTSDKGVTEIEGRKFEMVPRVAVCGKKTRAVVWFHSSDNPFGNPLQVYRTWAGTDRNVKERFYGWATRQYGCLFSRFSRKVHVVPAEKVPKDGTMYCIVDPAGNRNWFAVWILARCDGWYVVEEFPSQVREIEGVGVLGPWAEPDGKLRDGRRGDGQTSLGWSLMRYKEEFARVEGWRDVVSPALPVEKWREENGSEWVVFERMMDSRFGGAVQQGVQGVTTLIEECGRIGLTVVPATVDVAADGRHAVSEGHQFIQDALDWNEGEVMGPENRPKLWVSERCRNVIYALETHTGVDGQKGATKDVVDVLRMGFLKGMPYIAPGWRVKCEGGGHY